MSFSSFFTRTLGFGARRSTEDVQRAVLSYIDGRGKATPEEIARAMFSNEPFGTILYEILQAAQILVNQDELVATNEKGGTIDPIHGNSATILKRKIG